MTSLLDPSLPWPKPGGRRILACGCKLVSLANVVGPTPGPTRRRYLCADHSFQRSRDALEPSALLALAWP